MSVTRIEAAGQWFESYLQSLQGNFAVEQADKPATPLASPRDPFAESFSDIVTPELLKSDPSQWQKLDHYAILGLEHQRSRATLDEIKYAYKRRILKYHPDKGQGEYAKYYNGFFKCINKAYEVMNDKDKRKSFECVDPTFDNSVPPVVKDRFFEVFKPAMVRNAIWFVKQPTPDLGDLDTPRALVEKFYNFWSTEKTWREFSFYDDELPGSQDSRSDRRFVEKKNFAERTKKRDKEALRMRKLLDNCRNSDPRIALYKQQDVQDKEVKKQNRKAA